MGVHGARQDSVPAITTWLGRAGLLPFIAAPVAIYLWPEHQVLVGRALSVYALAIICFLVGIWWGLALIRRDAAALVLSNAVVIVAFFGHLGLGTAGFLALSALLFPGTVLAERRLSLFKPQPPYYARLRLQLTVVATLALILAALQL